MSSRNPVIWHEGLFVKPQHFQQQARATEAAVNQRLHSVNDALHGFSELALNDEYLSFGKIAITRARGIMPDGSVFDIPHDLAPPSPLEIADSSAVGQIVYLALPLRSNGALEVRWPNQYGNSRYIARREEIRDTHSDDGDQVGMDLAVPNLQLILERSDRSAFTGIALGRIKDKRPDGSLVMDEHFYPTSLSLQAVPALHRYLGEIAGLMRERAKNLAQRIGSPGQSGVADVTDFNLLQTLNRLFPLFQHLARQRQVHPERLTDTAGNTVWHSEYQAWGKSRDEWHDQQPGREQNLRFQGQYLDRETGLHYNTFRFFDPDVGRFTQPDPIGLSGGLNLYQYSPNPLTWIDPLGWKTYNTMESIDGFQKHHIIPRQLADHDALKASGMNIHQRSNIIYLPTDDKYHKTRTIHSGPHPAHTANIKRQLDAIDQYGKNNGWKKADYTRAINTIISEERKGLRTGRTYLNARSIRGNPCD